MNERLLPLELTTATQEQILIARNSINHELSRRALALSLEFHINSEGYDASVDDYDNPPEARVYWQQPEND